MHVIWALSPNRAQRKTYYDGSAFAYSILLYAKGIVLRMPVSTYSHLDLPARRKWQ